MTMEPQQVDSFDDEAVFRRTPLGQRELVWAHAALSAAQRRVLGVVTGYTPLGALVHLIGEAADTVEAIQGLAELAMIEKADRAERHVGWT